MSSLSKFRYANNRLFNLNFKIYIIYLKTIMLIFLIYSNTNFTIYSLKSMLNRSRNTKIQKQNKKKRKNKKWLSVYHNNSHSSITILEISPALFQTAPGTSSTDQSKPRRSRESMLQEHSGGLFPSIGSAIVYSYYWIAYIHCLSRRCITR